MTAFDPYKTLGVDREATAEDIKKAHRRRAKETHPDAGGDPTEFAEVTRAVECLSDPERRKKFDETGEDLGDKVDNTTSMAHGLIVRMIKAILYQEIGDPLAVEDLVGQMQGFLRKEIDEAERVKQKIEKAAARARKLRRRFHKKGAGENLIARIIDKQIDETIEPLRKIEHDIAARNAAIELLNEYDFEAEVSDMVFGNWTTVNIGGQEFHGRFGTTSSSV